MWLQVAVLTSGWKAKKNLIIEVKGPLRYGVVLNAQCAGNKVFMQYMVCKTFNWLHSDYVERGDKCMMSMPNSDSPVCGMLFTLL